MVRPKKHLGQHFLNDHNIASKIANALDIPGNCEVFEIGPGTGILTQFLLKKFNGRLKLFEIDIEMIPILLKRFPELSESIVHGDILELELSDHARGNIAVVGNLPYNISSQILFKVVENRNRVIQVVCMLQKEVAQRIASPPGSKDYGILSVLLQAYFRSEYLFTVGEKVFYPPPRVKSGVIRLTRNERNDEGIDTELFFKIVKSAFNQRRKILHNSLGHLIDPSVLPGVLAGKRAEELSAEDYLDLTRLIQS